jgi:peroxiredoxin
MGLKSVALVQSWRRGSKAESLWKNGSACLPQGAQHFYLPDSGWNRDRKPGNEMMKIKNCLLGATLSVLAATSLASSGLTGAPAPDFALKSSTGENLRLSEYRGDVVMINFWATWCGPCRQEMPLLDELYTRYERVGFSLLGVNIDDDSQRAMDMITELGVNFPVLFDDRKEVSKLYQVDAMPVTVLVDRDGNVRHVHHGYKPGYEQQYLDEIRSLLRE